VIRLLRAPSGRTTRAGKDEAGPLLAVRDASRRYQCTDRDTHDLSRSTGRHPRRPREWLLPLEGSRRPVRRRRARRSTAIAGTAVAQVPVDTCRASRGHGTPCASCLADLRGNAGSDDLGEFAVDATRPRPCSAPRRRRGGLLAGQGPGERLLTVSSTRTRRARDVRLVERATRRDRAGGLRDVTVVARDAAGNGARGNRARDRALE